MLVLSTVGDFFGPVNGVSGRLFPSPDVNTRDSSVGRLDDAGCDLDRVREQLELLMRIRNNNGLNPAWAACYQLLCQREVELLKTERLEGTRK